MPCGATFNSIVIVQGGVDHLFMVKKRVITVQKLQKDSAGELVR